MGDNPDHPPEPSREHRANLSARLATYRAQARRLGPHPDLCALFTAADQALAAQPYDPAAADRAVVTCMRALWHELGHPPQE